MPAISPKVKAHETHPLEEFITFFAMLLGVASFFLTFLSSELWYRKLRPAQKQSDSACLEFFIWLPIVLFLFFIWHPIAIVVVVFTWIVWVLWGFLLTLGSPLFHLFQRTDPETRDMEISVRAPFVKPGSGRRKLSGAEYRTQLGKWLLFQIVGWDWKDDNRKHPSPGPIRAKLSLLPPWSAYSTQQALPQQTQGTATMNCASRLGGVGPNGKAATPGAKFPPEISDNKQEIEKEEAANGRRFPRQTVSDEVTPLDSHRTGRVTALDEKAVSPGDEDKEMWRTKNVPWWELINLCGLTHAPPWSYADEEEEKEKEDNTLRLCHSCWAVNQGKTFRATAEVVGF